MNKIPSPQLAMALMQSFPNPPGWGNEIAYGSKSAWARCHESISHQVDWIVCSMAANAEDYDE